MQGATRGGEAPRSKEQVERDEELAKSAEPRGESRDEDGRGPAPRWQASGPPGTLGPARRRMKGLPAAWDVIVRTWKGVSLHNTTNYASVIAYSMLSSIFPFLLALASLLAFLPIPHLFDMLMGLLGQLAPSAAITLVRNTVRYLVTRQHGELLSLGLLGTLWGASGTVLSFMQAFNNILAARETRPFWQTRGIALLLAIGVTAFIALGLVALWFGSYVTHWRTVLGPLPTLMWNVVRWPLTVFSLIVAVNLLYYVAPTVKRPWKWLTPGAIFAVLGWMAASIGFSIYASHFGSYDKTYGSIGTVILLLSWIYLGGLFILLGFEINVAKDARESDRSLAYSQPPVYSP